MERELDRTVRFLRSYIDRHGYAPSIRETQTALRLASTSVVAYRLKMLERRGVIHWQPGLSRTITLIEQKEIV